MYKAYTGVGSRETPKEIQDLMVTLADRLASEGWTLRSGGAEGADTAFEKGWWDELNLRNSSPGAEIYIPWDGFNNHRLSSHDGCNLLPMDNFEQAKRIASTIHPAWDNLKPGAKTLHARNCYQVLGKSLDNPSKFLVCWAQTDKNGVPKGGTRTAWVLAQQYEIPCFNLVFDEHREKIENYIGRI